MGLGVAALLCCGVASGVASIARRTGTDVPGGGEGASGPGPGFELPAAWFVEMPSPPLAEADPASEAKYLAKLRQEKQSFRVAAGQAGIRFRERYAYDVLWNGLSVEADLPDVMALSRIPGVTAVYPVAPVNPPEPPTPVDAAQITPELFNAVAMSGADDVQASGITGAGVKVAIIDSGIDYRHPDLGGGFGPGFRVDGGFDFVGDFYLGGGTVPIPDANPLDCNGHGTHVAGIIGANGGARGVAPGATLRAYRVFGCGGGTESDVLLAAMERVLSDGNQVVNMSLGAPFQWPQFPTARASDNLVRRGVVVVASAGNSGANGLFSMSAPGVGRKVIGVGSVENLKVHSPAFRLLGGPQVGYQPLQGAREPPLSGTTLIADGGSGCNFDRARLVGTSGRVVLLSRGGCSLREKVINARNAGTTAAVIYNSVPGIFIDTLGEIPIQFPAATLAREDGLFILPRTPIQMTWTADFTEALNADAGRVSAFSSFGDSPDLALKPDLSAPGGRIFSTLPLGAGLYGLASGTSMSSPYVAGAVALLLEAHPNTPSAAVRDILQNTAVPRLWREGPSTGVPDSAHRQGAGLLDIASAIQATVRVTPGQISFGETEGGPVTRSLSIENSGPSGVTLELSHRPAMATGPETHGVDFIPAAAGVAFGHAEIFVPAGGAARVDVTVTDPPSLPPRSLFGGYVVLTPRDGGRALSVPFTAFKGDYQSIVVMGPDASVFGNPMLRPSLSIGPSEPIAIDPLRGPLAHVVAHLAHPARRVRLEVFEAGTLRERGRVAEFGYFPRNSQEDLFFAFVWNGRDLDQLPLTRGDYLIRMSVQKALGEDDIPAHWESWTSPVVTVDY